MSDGWRRLLSGDVVEVNFEKGRRYVPRPKPRPHAGFQVVYEDRDLIVVDKGAELLTVPTRREEPGTLVARVSQYVRRSKGGRGAFVVHRLDRGVSGLLVFAKTREIADQLRDQFAERKPERRYLAIVIGTLPEPRGTYRSFLATDEALNRFSTDDEQVGQLAVTHFRVLEPLAGASLVEVKLETGRRNQIRVHFSEAGHPVLGDPRYEPEQASHRHWPYKRLALHALTLGFVHPFTKDDVKFESHMPSEMMKFINRNRTTNSAAAKLSSAPSPRGRDAANSAPDRGGLARGEDQRKQPIARRGKPKKGAGKPSGKQGKRRRKS